MPIPLALVCVTVASKLSTLYNIASVAKEQVKQELPQTQIEILDSETSMMGQGFVALTAAKASAEGKGLDGIIEAALRVKERVDVLFFLETLRHLYRSGRVPRLTAWVGAALHIKPVVREQRGIVHFVTAAMTKNRGVDCLLALSLLL
jgi:DegV family protein with EDD domain